MENILSDEELKELRQYFADRTEFFNENPEERIKHMRRKGEADCLSLSESLKGRKKEEMKEDLGDFMKNRDVAFTSNSIILYSKSGKILNCNINNRKNEADYANRDTLRGLFVATRGRIRTLKKEQRRLKILLECYHYTKELDALDDEDYKMYVESTKVRIRMIGESIYTYSISMKYIEKRFKYLKEE